jgi:hypothetical protein
VTAADDLTARVKVSLTSGKKRTLAVASVNVLACGALECILGEDEDGDPAPGSVMFAPGTWRRVTRLGPDEAVAAAAAARFDRFKREVLAAIACRGKEGIHNGRELVRVLGAHRHAERERALRELLADGHIVADVLPGKPPRYVVRATKALGAAPDSST